MRHRLTREIALFNQLTFASRRLFISSTIYEFAYPLLFTFLNAFLFRNTGGFVASVLFNVGLFIALPTAFFINGLLLKRMSSKWLFSAGLIGQGLIAGIVFLLPGISPTAVMLLGFLQGIPMGLYWSNRNFIVLDVTHDSHRNYYAGLEMIVGNLAGIASPLLIGWILVLVSRWSTLTIEQVYQLLAAVATLALLVAGRSIFAAQITNPRFKKLWLGSTGPVWTKARVREVLYGMGNGLKIVLPPLLVMLALGSEEVLGTVQSVAAVVASGALYIMARKISVHRRRHMLVVFLLLNLLITIPLALFFSPWAITFFLVTLPSIAQFTWLVFLPMQLKLVDEEDGGDPTNNYAYVVDREIFLNMGRLTAVAIFSGLFLFGSNELGVRFLPVIVAVLELAIIFLL